MKKFFISCFVLMAPAFGVAALHTEVITYQHAGATLEGYLVYDDAVKTPRPGVLVVHEWWGHNDYVRKRAEQLANLGYVAFALDMYGKGQATTDPKKAGEVSSFFKSDRNLMRGRAEAGLRVLQKRKEVNAKKIAAIGYCFGGTCVLELARGGANVAGVVSFHGGLDSPNPQDAKNIKGKVLVLTGGDDNYVPPLQIQAFEEEMRNAKVDWQMGVYGGAVHAFTNPAAGNDNSKGVAYNQKADVRSWQAMKDFFNEIFQ